MRDGLREAAVECCIGGLAGSAACVFTNPLEVVKTRQQLQGELQARGAYRRHYGGLLSALATVARVDGPAAVQRGLAMGMAYQVAMNGIRLGAYQLFDNWRLTSGADGRPAPQLCVLYGGLAGALGGFAASPLYLVKTREQSRSSLSVGTQHARVGAGRALAALWREAGLRGLWRGAPTQTARVMVGSSAQLATFSLGARRIEELGHFGRDAFAVSLLASCCSALAVTVAMAPLDTLSTRIYNQPFGADGRGRLYRGLLHAFGRVLATEGPLGLYKGAAAVFFRTGPHTVLSLLFWSQFRRLLP